MNSIRRLLGEADQDCFAPVLASSSAPLMARQRRARSLFRQREDVLGEREEPEPTTESLAAELRQLCESAKGTPALDRWTKLIEKLAESISTNSMVPFDAEITVSTTRQTNVVTSPRPPEKDPVIATILGKEPPVQDKPPLEQVQQQKNQQQTPGPDTVQANQPRPPTPQQVQKAYEDALNGVESRPKMEIVESSSMSSAMNLLQMESLPSGGPLLGAPPAGSSGKVWGAFKKFVKK